MNEATGLTQQQFNVDLMPYQVLILHNTNGSFSILNPKQVKQIIVTAPLVFNGEYEVTGQGKTANLKYQYKIYPLSKKGLGSYFMELFEQNYQATLVEEIHQMLREESKKHPPANWKNWVGYQTTGYIFDTQFLIEVINPLNS